MSAELIQVPADESQTHPPQEIVTSPELAEEITRQCVESMVDAGDAVQRFVVNLRRAWEGKVWLPLGIPTPEEWASQRLSPQAQHFSRAQRTQVFVAVAGGGLLATSLLAAALDVSEDTVNRALRPIKAASADLRIEKASQIKLTPRMRDTVAKVVAYHDAASAVGAKTGQVATAASIGKSQSTVHAANVLLRAQPELADQLRAEGLPNIAVPNDPAIRPDLYADTTDFLGQSAAKSMAATLLGEADAAAHDLLATLDDFKRCIEDPVGDTDLLYRADLAAVIVPVLAEALGRLVWTARMLGVDAERFHREGEVHFVDDPRRAALQFRHWWAWARLGRVPTSILAEQDHADPGYVTRVVSEIQAMHPDRHVPEHGARPPADTIPEVETVPT